MTLAELIEQAQALVKMGIDPATNVYCEVMPEPPGMAVRALTLEAHTGNSVEPGGWVSLNQERHKRPEAEA